MAFEKFVNPLAECLGFSPKFVRCVLKGFYLARSICKGCDDYSGCVSIQYLHNHPKRVVLTRKAPDGVVVYPPKERTFCRSVDKE